MIGNMLNKTEVGYFATAGKFVDLILFLPAVLVQTITPILVREKESNYYRYEAKKRTFLGITTWVSLLMALVISLSAYWMIIYTYGEKYALAIPVLQIMAFKAECFGMFFVCDIKLSVYSKVWNYWFCNCYCYHCILHRMYFKYIYPIIS